MRTSRRLLTIGKACFVALLGVLILLNVIGIVKKVFFGEQVPLAFGIGTAVIITGSMEPHIAPGDMVILRRANDYRVGDVVTYRAHTPITHRVVEKTAGGFITRGDANNAPDGEIARERIIGRVVAVVPRVGIAILFLQSPAGVLLLIAALFALVETPRLIRSLKKRKRGKHARG